MWCKVFMWWNAEELGPVGKTWGIDVVSVDTEIVVRIQHTQSRKGVRPYVQTKWIVGSGAEYVVHWCVDTQEGRDILEEFVSDRPPPTDTDELAKRLIAAAIDLQPCFGCPVAESMDDVSKLVLHEAVIKGTGFLKVNKMNTVVETRCARVPKHVPEH